MSTSQGHLSRVGAVEDISLYSRLDNVVNYFPKFCLAVPGLKESST